MLTGAVSALAQSHVYTDTVSVALYFRNGHYTLEPHYLDNELSLAEFTRKVDMLRNDLTADVIDEGKNVRFRIKEFRIIGSASPEGDMMLNKVLSKKRAKHIVNYLRSEMDIPEELIVVEDSGIDWDGMIYALNKLGYGSEVHRIESLKKIAHWPDDSYDTYSRRVDALNSRLRRIDGGELWQDLVMFVFPWLRASQIMMIVEVHKHDTVAEAESLPYQEIEVAMPEIALDYKPEQAPVLSEGAGPYRMKERRPVLSFSTNLLLPAFNVGMDIPMGNRISLGFAYYYPWMSGKNNDWCVQLIAGFADLKYWFGKNRTSADRLSGHSVGLYGGYGYYDFQWKQDGYQGDFIDVGVEYTYALPVANGRCRIEFSLGLGWIHSKVEHYTPTLDYSALIRDPGIKYRMYDIIGPTKAEISFVLPVWSDPKPKAKKEVAE